MTDARQLDVVFCWHMHQPQYRRAIDREYQLPWTYLHAIKDYADMAWHLERSPSARAVVNFTPVLLDQLDDYADQFASRRFRNPLLQGLAEPASVPAASRPALLAGLLRANEARMIRRFEPFARLRTIFESARVDDHVEYLSDGYLADLAVWYHLAWIGESIRRHEERVQRLMSKAASFDAADR
ncbi:MAG TPA: hypothetical protein VEJ20_00085, partial [Candidatus Eremiobacteraceae bacterium]|nr:hypothetical protein [Candidatus Eremiobacteraceae bacterium]